MARKQDGGSNQYSVYMCSNIIAGEQMLNVYSLPQFAVVIAKCIVQYILSYPNLDYSASSVT